MISNMYCTRFAVKLIVLGWQLLQNDIFNVLASGMSGLFSDCPIKMVDIEYETFWYFQMLHLI